jgi:hypothetical protein
VPLTCPSSGQATQIIRLRYLKLLPCLPLRGSVRSTLKNLIYTAMRPRNTLLVLIVSASALVLSSHGLQAQAMSKTKTLVISGCSPTIANSLVSLDPKLYSRLSEMIMIRNRVCDTVLQSKGHADRANFMFRSFGTIVILLSASLPLASLIKKPWQLLVTSALAVCIATMTGINSFYDFQGTWGKSRLAQYRLRYEIMIWDQAVSSALALPPSEQLTALNSATNRLMQSWNAVVMKRADEYFSVQEFKIPK